MTHAAAMAALARYLQGLALKAGPDAFEIDRAGIEAMAARYRMTPAEVFAQIMRFKRGIAG
ncbi:MAG: hypothetical protein LBV29_01160 [Azoarcus sp.]|jgi:hypothetical protein|nr:hypothetical protein [Azoarcus sp.]